jgi:hypothetical protein
LLLVVDESDKVITSFLTLAKNCEAHWFNCRWVDPGINRCRLRHLTWHPKSIVSIFFLFLNDAPKKQIRNN